MEFIEFVIRNQLSRHFTFIIEGCLIVRLFYSIVSLYKPFRGLDPCRMTSRIREVITWRESLINRIINLTIRNGIRVKEKKKKSRYTSPEKWVNCLRTLLKFPDLGLICCTYLQYLSVPMACVFKPFDLIWSPVVR